MIIHFFVGSRSGSYVVVIYWRITFIITIIAIELLVGSILSLLLL